MDDVKDSEAEKVAPDIGKGRHNLSVVLFLFTVSMVFSSTLMLLYHLFFHRHIPPPFRLSPDITPYYYDIDLQVYPLLNPTLNFGSRNNTIEGRVEIKFTSNSNLSVIIMNAQQLKVTDAITIIEEDTQSIVDVIGFRMFSKHHHFVIFLGGELKEGIKYSMVLGYQAQIIHDPEVNDKQQQMGAYTVSNDSKRKNLVLITQFQFFEASRAFPCFDDPSMKAQFQFHITHPSGYTALSNMPSTNEYKINGDFTKTDFAVTPLMSTYLTAFYVGDYAGKEARVGKVPIRIFARNDTVERTETALQIAVKTVEFFTDYFGIPYQLPKLDLVVVGKLKIIGMENWGLVMVKDSDIIMEFGLADDDRFKHKVAELVIHEICHQWFGNLAGPKWFDDHWFIEGLTSFLTKKTMDFVLDEDASSRTMLKEKHSVYNFHEVPNDVVRQTVTGPLYHEHMSVALLYLKSSTVFRLLEQTVGKELMRDAIADFITQYSYSSATSQDFFKLLDQKLHGSKHELVAKGYHSYDLVEGWIQQKNLPEIHVKRWNETHSIITQSMYDPLRMATQNSHHKPLNLPIFWIQNKTNRFDILTKHEPLLIDTAIIDYSHLYSVVYDDDLLHEVLTMSSSIKDNQKANLLFNIYIMAMQNKMPINTVLFGMKKLLVSNNHNSILMYQHLSRSLLATFYYHSRRKDLQKHLTRPLEASFNYYCNNYNNSFGINDQGVAEFLMTFLCEMNPRVCSKLANKLMKKLWEDCGSNPTKDCIKVPIPLRRGFFNYIMASGNEENINYTLSIPMRKLDDRKLYIAKSFLPFKLGNDSSENLYDYMDYLFPIIGMGKSGISHGASLKVVTLLDFLIRTGLPEKYEQKPPPELRKYLKPDLKSMMEFLTVFPKSSFEWFSQNYDCSEYFKSLPGAKKNCDIFAARYRIRTDIFESNEDTLSKMLDLRRF